jgi:hypothetical protein
MKYIIYKGSGGLAHMIKGLSAAIFLAKKKKRHLIIDTKNSSELKINFSDFFIIEDNELNWYDNYDIAPPIEFKFRGYSKEDIKNAICYYRGDKCFFNDICVSEGYKYDDDIIIMAGHGRIGGVYKIGYNLDIKINDKIKSKIFEYNIPKKYISVHYRNSDIKNDINKVIEQINNISKNHNIDIVYLSTDDYDAYTIIQKSIGDIKLIQYAKLEDVGKNTQHYSCKNKEDMVFYCLVDIYMVLKSNIFIPSYNSGLSQYIIYMIQSNKNIFDVETIVTIL